MSLIAGRNYSPAGLISPLGRGRASVASMKREMCPGFSVDEFKK
jgi:hypothetical protein